MCHYSLLPGEEDFLDFYTRLVLCYAAAGGRKGMRTEGNFFHGDRKHLHITLGSCIIFQVNMWQQVYYLLE